MNPKIVQLAKYQIFMREIIQLFFLYLYIFNNFYCQQPLIFNSSLQAVCILYNYINNFDYAETFRD